MLTPAEARALLRRARSTDTLGYWVMGMFAGVRTNELRRIQRLEDPWSVIRFSAGIIDLSRAITKTAARTVPICRALRLWLRWMRPRGVPFLPPNWWRKTHPIRNAVLKDEMHPGKRDVRIRNIARRSYISHSLALPDATFAAVCDAVGNSEAVSRRHYYRRVSRADALCYFALTPNRI